MAGVESLKARVARVTDYKDTVDGEAVWVRVLGLELPEKSAFSYQPGQFCMLSHDDFKRWDDPSRLKQAPLSICSSPLQKGVLEFCLRVHYTPGLLNYLGHKVGVGDTVNVQGPYGVFTMKEAFTHAYLIGAGTGIAPLISMLRHHVLSKDPRPITLFYGFWNSKTFLYREELEGYARDHEQVSLVTSISSRNDPDWKGPVGYIQETFKDHAFPDEMEGVHAYVCGNPRFLQAVLEALPRHGFRPENIHREKW